MEGDRRDEPGDLDAEVLHNMSRIVLKSRGGVLSDEAPTRSPNSKGTAGSTSWQTCEASIIVVVASPRCRQKDGHHARRHDLDRPDLAVCLRVDVASGAAVAQKIR